MDVFLSICQGIGLALAAGTLAGSPGRGGALGAALLALAVAGGAALFALTLDADDYSALPGIAAGAVVAPLGFVVARAVAAGAGERAASGTDGAEGSAAAIGVTIAIAALAIAALATLISPVSLLFLAAFAWLALGRRRRDRRKYEGLRVLR
jgi:hypothetical protein